MKFATIRFEENVYAGLVKDDRFFAFKDVDPQLPNNMLNLIEGYERFEGLLVSGLDKATSMCALSEVQFLPPLPNPRSFRDYMGFEEHLINSGKRFKRPVEPAWYEMPVFYFSNHNNLLGSGQPLPVQPNSKMPDFEFEIGFVIGKKGRDIPADKAGDYIFGFTILNDWSARDLQMSEMSVGLGPAKAKDYATSIGPVLVTKDEVDSYLCDGDPLRYNMTTRLYRNGQLLRENNTRTIYHTFAAMIERASQDVDILPGDLFGSGTIGGGTLIEYPEGTSFLGAGDVIEMEVECLGTLKNIVI